MSDEKLVVCLNVSLRGLMMNEYLCATRNKTLALSPDNTDLLEELRRDAALDEALKCTFPASDPVSLTAVFTLPSEVSPHDQQLLVRLSKHLA
jgi:hypothetical protein